MIEIIGAVCPKQYLCDKCVNRRRYMVNDSGNIYGVFCLDHNDIITPIPTRCSGFSSNVREMAKDQRTLTMEF